MVPNNAVAWFSFSGFPVSACETISTQLSCSPKQGQWPHKTCHTKRLQKGPLWQCDGFTEPRAHFDFERLNCNVSTCLRTCTVRVRGNPEVPDDWQTIVSAEPATHVHGRAQSGPSPSVHTTALSQAAASVLVALDPLPAPFHAISLPMAQLLRAGSRASANRLALRALCDRQRLVARFASGHAAMNRTLGLRWDLTAAEVTSMTQELIQR